MKKNDVIRLLSDRKYLRICRKITGGNDLYEDLFQETILILLEYSEEFFLTLKCAECFFIKIADRNWNSATSRFYYKYRKGQTDTPLQDQPEAPQYDIDSDSQFEKKLSGVKKILDAQYWYDRAIWEMYQQEGSSRKVGKRLKIPFRSVARTINRVKKTIHENITLC